MLAMYGSAGGLCIGTLGYSAPTPATQDGQKALSIAFPSNPFALLSTSLAFLVLFFPTLAACSALK